MTKDNFICVCWFEITETIIRKINLKIQLGILETMIENFMMFLLHFQIDICSASRVFVDFIVNSKKKMFGKFGNISKSKKP